MSILINSERALDLQLFGEGTGAAGAASDGGNAGIGAGANLPDAAAKSGEGADPAADNNAVREVKPEDRGFPGAKASVGGSEDRNKAFERLISEDYKDLFESKVKDLLSKRLSKTNDTVKKYKALEAAREILGKQYNCDPDDAEALTRAIVEDNSFYQKEAIESGMSVEAVKKMHRLERENTQWKRHAEEEARERNAEETVRRWRGQADEAKKVYPNLDLDSEIKNPDFLALIQNNVDVRTAFEVIHKDEIIGGAMQYAVKTAEKKLANNIAANGARPKENGIGGAAASLTRTSIKDMTKAQMDELIARAARGERIVF